MAANAVRDRSWRRRWRAVTRPRWFFSDPPSEGIVGSIRARRDAAFHQRSKDSSAFRRSRSSAWLVVPVAKAARCTCTHRTTGTTNKEENSQNAEWNQKIRWNRSTWSGSCIFWAGLRSGGSDGRAGRAPRRLRWRFDGYRRRPDSKHLKRHCGRRQRQRWCRLEHRDGRQRIGEHRPRQSARYPGRRIEPRLQQQRDSGIAGFDWISRTGIHGDPRDLGFRDSER
jgi:hypothetical protein